MATVSRLAYWGASALALGAVAGIGVWANGSAPEVPLKIEPAPSAGTSSAASPSRAIIPPSVETPVASASSSNVRGAIRRIAVDVEGAVAMPGVYYLLEGDRVLDAVRRAGGATGRGSTAGMNLAAPLRDGMKILVPLAPAHGSGVGGAPTVPPPAPPTPSAGESDLGGAGGDPPPASGSEPGLVTEAPGASPSEGGGRAAPRSRSAKGSDLAPYSVDVNAASAEELARLPGVGPSTARKIIEERERRGGFRSVDELIEVKGIGPAKLERMRPYVRV